MKTFIRFQREDNALVLQLLDLKYKNKVVAEKKLTEDDKRWLISVLTEDIR